MASTADFRNGMVLQIDGQLFQIVYFQHVKPGKGGAFVRSKLKNVRTGAVLDRRWTAGERVTEVRLERRPVQYSYGDGDLRHFMDMETYDDIPITDDIIGDDQLKYLKEGMECSGLVHDGNVIMIELPLFIELEVTETDPGVRGYRRVHPSTGQDVQLGNVRTPGLFGLDQCRPRYPHHRRGTERGRYGLPDEVL